MRRYNQPGGATAAPDLLDQDRCAQVIRARAAVFLRDVQSQQPQPAQLAQRLPGKLAALISMRGNRFDLFVDEVSNKPAQASLFVGQLKIHGSLL